MKSATRSANSAFFDAIESGVFPPTGGILKRSFDITVDSLALGFISPIFLLLVLLVKFSNQVPIFYGHLRIGHNGQTFRCLKFRTMVVDGDRVLQAYLQANPKAQEEWRA